MREVAIETRSLTMRFPQQQGWQALFRREPGQTALQDVDLAVYRGEIFGLLGPNGAGKTTLVRVLSTLVVPTAGQALVAGLDVVRESLAVRRRIGVVYGDERSFYWRLSALENLLFYAALYGIPSREAHRRAWDLLDLVGLAGSAHLRMHHYSSGMRQRAAIARGLLNDPDVLIMDEPTRSLDPIAALELRRLVKERVADGRRTVLIATNIMAEAEFLCDRIAFIARGELQLTGHIEQLRDLLQGDEMYEVTVSGLGQDSLEGLRHLPGVDSLRAVPDEAGRYRLEVRARRGAAVLPAIVRRLVEAGGDVWSCRQRQLTLEEMFALIVEKGRQERAQERVPA